MSAAPLPRVFADGVPSLDEECGGVFEFAIFATAAALP